MLVIIFIKCYNIVMSLIEFTQSKYIEGVDTVTCQNCAACCKTGMAIDLTDENANFLRSTGTELELIEKPKRRRILLGVTLSKTPAETTATYRLNTNCSQLTEDGKCAVIDDDSRPSACGKFVVGGAICHDVRLEERVESPDAYMQYIQATGQDSPELIAALREQVTQQFVS